MKIKKALQLAIATVLSVAGLSILAVPSAFAATVTWTGSASASFGLNGCTLNCWSIGGNWLGGVAPTPGDDIVFDNTILSSDLITTDDITGLSVNSITFQGSSSNSQAINGQPLSVTAGVTSTTNATSIISVNLTVTANQAFSGSSLQSSITLASVTGSSNITISGGHIVFVDLSNYTGSITANGGDVDLLNQGTFTSAGSIVINNGAALLLDNGGSGNVTYNLPITLAGSGDGSSGTALVTSGGTGFNQTLLGSVVLASNVQLSGPAGTVTVTGPLSGAFTLTVASGASVKLVISSSNNTSNSPNTPTPSNAPRAPNTGLAATSTNPTVVLAITLIAAISLVAIALRFKLGKVK